MLDSLSPSSVQPLKFGEVGYWGDRFLGGMGWLWVGPLMLVWGMENRFRNSHPRSMCQNVFQVAPKIESVVLVGQKSRARDLETGNRQKIL